MLIRNLTFHFFCVPVLDVEGSIEADENLGNHKEILFQNNVKV